MLASYGGLRPLHPPRQWPHSSVRKMNIAHFKIRGGEYAIRFAQQVGNFCFARHNVSRVALVPDIRGADQVLIIPRNNEKGPAVRTRLDIKCRTWRPVEMTDNNMTALGAAHEQGHLAINSRQDPINPWTGCINDEAGAYFHLRTVGTIDKLEAAYATLADTYSYDRAVIPYISTGFFRANDIFQHKAFSETYLRIVILCAAKQAICIKSRLFLQQLIFTQHAVMRIFLTE